MSRHSSSDPPMIARPAGATARMSSPPSRKRPTLVETSADPDKVVDEIMEHLNDERYSTAKKMAEEAAKRFPDHHRVQGAWGIFDIRNRTRVGTGGPGPSQRENYDWLRQDHPSLGGKLVALVSGKLVAAADTAEELSEALEGLTFSQTPLVVRLG